MAFTLVMLPPQSDTSRKYAQQLAIDVPDLAVLLPSSDGDLLRALQVADAAYGTLPAELVQHANRLRWLQCPWAGPPPGYYSAELVDHPVVVTNMRGTYTDEVATHAMMLLLALARGLPAYVAQQHRHLWQQSLKSECYLLLSEATILIVGLGAVGAEVARLLAPFGGTVIGTDARLTKTPPFVEELHPAEHLDALLPRADAVVVTVPHTPRTERLFAQPRFDLMKPGALLINVGRGPVVDIDDLISAVRSGRLRAVALDVVPLEPLTVDSPLWDMPEVIITPHVASAAMAGEGRGDEARYRLLVENALRFCTGEPLLNVVDKASWF